MPARLHHAKKLGKPILDSANKMVYPDESKYKLNLFFEDGKLKYYTKDGKYKNLDNNSIETAYDAYQKAFELDTKKEYKDQLDVKLFICGSSFFDKGALLYNGKKYKEAIDYFDRTAKINSMVGYTDTLATYYAALSCELSDQPAKAKDYYIKLIKVNYKKPAIYSGLANIYKNEKDSTNAFKYIKKGLDAFPGDLDLMVSQTYIYITFGKIPQALANLKSVTDKDKSNARLYYVVGVCCDNIINDSLAKQTDKDEASALGESAYQKATELKPDFFDAFYYYGALYVNKAASIYAAADKLPLSAKKEYDEKRAQGDELLKKAMVPLEKAIALQPDDLPTLNALKQIYMMLKLADKLKETNAKIDQLKGKKN